MASQQGIASCLGILRLAKTYPAERRSGRPALPAGARLQLQSMDSILTNQIDRLPLPGDPPVQAAVEHDNIRGADYFDSPPEADSSGDSVSPQENHAQPTND